MIVTKENLKARFQARLESIVFDHGCSARMVDGRLLCSGWVVNCNLPVGHPERVELVEEEVESTLQAVRDWLGY